MSYKMAELDRFPGHRKEDGGSRRRGGILRSTPRSIGDKMAHVAERKHNRSPTGVRPNMSDLRIFLLGSNASENNRVGNIILNKNVFVKKRKQPDVEMFSERVERRNITVISTTKLLNPQLSVQALVKKASELFDPEPHVIILVLQHSGFSKIHRDILPSVLNCFGDQMKKRTMILTTDDEKRRYENEFIQQISTEYKGGRLQLQHTQSSQILQKVDEIICRSGFNETEQTSLSQEHSRSGRSEEKTRFWKHKVSKHLNEKTDLNLVLCGHDATLKILVSKKIEGEKINPLDERAVSVDCVKKEEKISGRQLSVVELPALSRLSEEEVMRQTLLSVTLCHPGVHAFIFIVPFGPLANEEKEEVEKILKIFDSREHVILLFTSDLSDEGFVREFVKHMSESQSLISLCGGRYRLMGLKEPENSRQIPDLLDYIENMKTEPYSLQMYVKAQENRVRRELEEQHKNKFSEMKNKIKELEEKILTEGGAECSDDLKHLRIVLIGRTGNGKSATGNTILGRNEFVSKTKLDSVTTVCEKGVGEAHGRSVSVVDTPGLFDTALTNEQVAEEIMKCVSLSSPGPHVFVIVLSLGRITREEADTLDLIKKIFGPKAAQFSIVLFTRGDDLQGESIQDSVRDSNSAELKKLIRDCGERFLVFNNREKQDQTQVIQLIKMIEEVKNTNQGRYFTNSMFEEAEMNIKKRMEEIMKEREKEIQKEREDLQAKYEMEMENMMKRLEAEKQRADEERMKMENEFREKEEKMKKVFEEKEKTEQIKQEIENQKQLDEEKQQRAEYDRKIEEMKRMTENQRSEYEKQQKEREEEDRKREEKYRRDQEKMRNEQESIIAELRIKQKEEIKKRDLDEKQRNEEKEEERQKWKRRIKEAENERKEIQEEIKRQQREWEYEKKRQMREREEEEGKRKEKHEEQQREKQEELEKMRKRFEREREDERQNIEEEREKQRREREKKEREYEEKKQEMKRHYEQREWERKEEWERRKREDEERLEEERKKMIEKLNQERENERKNREREEKERNIREQRQQNEMKQKHEEEINKMKKEHEDKARKQAEELNDFKEGKEELQQMLDEHKRQHKILDTIYKILQYFKWPLEMTLRQKEAKEFYERLHVEKEQDLIKLQGEVETFLEEKKREKCTIL